MKEHLRYLYLSIATLAATLVVALVGAVAGLHESPQNVQTLLGYIAVTGALALLVGFAGVSVGNRYLPKLSLKVAVAYAVGSVGAIATIAYTPLLMFQSAADLHLLVLLLLCFTVISLGLGGMIALGLSDRLTAFRSAARSVAEGNFTTHVEVRTRDELSDLARAFNTMSSQLGEAFARQKSDEQGRRELLSAISHDLRTPLAGIKAMLEAIEDGVVTDATVVRSYHVAMREEVNRLSRLIEDLFELSRLESGNTQLHLAPVDLNELVQETVESMRPMANLRGVMLSASSFEDPSVGRVDADAIQRVLVNLVHNAIRHTPKGGAIIVTVKRQDANLAIEVRDSGEGIGPEEAARVFDRFYRGEKARTRANDTGAGLGLAIAKAIVEAHEGRIWVEDRTAGGATFVFTLPRSAEA